MFFFFTCLNKRFGIMPQILRDDWQFHMVEATYRVKEARKQLYSETGKHPKNEEIAEATGLSMKRLMAVLLSPKPPRSLDQKIGMNQNLKPSVGTT